MSLINQMLQDLEKRRASATERSGIAQYVRALPQASSTPIPRWLVGAAAGFSIVVLTAFAAAELKIGPGAWKTAASVERLAPAETSKAPAVVASSVPAPVAESSPAATAPVAETPIGIAPLAMQPASRMTLEISDPPSLSTQNESRVIAPSGPNQRVAAASAKVPARAPERTAHKVAMSSPARAAPLPSEQPAVADVAPQLEKNMKQVSPKQRAENDFRRGSELLQQGRSVEAQEAFREAIALNAGHDGARQALLGLLIEGKRNADAERLLQDRLNMGASHPGFAMALARLQVERGDNLAAIETLNRTRPFAAHSADYLAFLAAVLQRASRHAEAIEQYRAALGLNHNAGVWWMGIGISLQAIDRVNDAQEAFRRARASNSLNPELLAFVEQRLKQLQ